MKKLYEFPLPVNKQGDDFAQHIEHCDTPRDALFSLAEQFELAADLCRRVARKATDELSVECAQGHAIIISDEEDNMAPLEEEEVLFEVEEEVCGECKHQMN
jgi:hypothetical protein